LTGLCPKDDWQALLCDEVMDAAEDISARIGQTIDLPADAKKKAREELAAGHLARYLEHFQARLKAAGGEYFADRHLTVADLKVFMLIRWLRSGALDHVPKDLVDRVAPMLVEHLERMASHPKIVEYYKRRKAALSHAGVGETYVCAGAFHRGRDIAPPQVSGSRRKPSAAPLARRCQ
jgi:glutathione S-transferase